MRIVVFGATGKTGSAVLERARERGHDVVAFVRSPDKLSRSDVDVVQGDATEQAAVARAVRGADAVISCIGQAKGAPADVQTQAISNIVEAMQQNAVRRVVSVTGAAVPAERDPVSVRNELMRRLLLSVAADRYRDGVRHAEVLRESGLDYTLVRAPRMTKSAMRGDYRVGFFHLGPLARISYADVAHFCVDCLENDAWVGEEPIVSW